MILINNKKIKCRFSKFFSEKNKLFSKKNFVKRRLFSVISKCIVLLILIAVVSSCDKTRSYARKGNHKYNKKNYTEAVNNYKQSLKADSTFSQVNYNMGNAVMQESGKDYAQAVNYYNKYLADKSPKTTKEKKEIADALYNRGNALFGLSQTDKQSEEGMKYLAQAAQDYKQAMIMNPEDSNAKYNYALCMWLMKNNNQPDNNKDNQNNNSNSEVQQMLNAMKNNEKNTISKVKKQEENVRNKSNEKDW